MGMKDIELETMKLKALKEQEIIRAETEKLRQENELLIFQTKLEKEIKAKKLKAIVEAEAIKLMADAEEYKQNKINEIASSRPENLNIETFMKIQNDAVQHFGKAAWRHPDLVEAMVGINNNSNNCKVNKNDYQSVVNNSINQAVSMMHMRELTNNKVFSKKKFKKENSFDNENEAKND